METSIKTKEFIDKAKKIHGERYDYSLVDYKNNHTKVKIICPKHGLFNQAPSSHLVGSLCRNCAHNSTTEEFIEKAKKIHGDRYDYSEVEYIQSKKKVKIGCEIHGIFEQAPHNHLNGANCHKCSKKSKEDIRRRTTEQFIEKAIKVHGDLYEYFKVDYKDGRSKVIITCKIHGDYYQTPNTHLNGHGCQKCAVISMASKATKTTEHFIEEAKKVHRGKYTYEKTEYIRGSDKIIITCPTHSYFQQAPNNHLVGQGCPLCNKESIGYSRTNYIRIANGRICTFYTLRCFNENEEFYKIGITMRTVKERYNNTTTMPYSYEIVSEVFGEAGVIWDMEKEEKRDLKEFYYQPKINFNGSVTECFTQYKNNQEGK